MTHSGIDNQQVTVKVGFALQGHFKAFVDGPPGIYNTGAGRKKSEHWLGFNDFFKEILHNEVNIKD
jgi:hypothetical protein